jgi:uroporphyrin-3 C-methyltransferase
VSSQDNDAEFDPFENDPVSRKSNGSKSRSGTAVAWLALLLALATMAFNAFQWWQAQSEETQALDQQASINELRNSRQSLETQLTSLQSRIQTMEGRDESAALSPLQSGLDTLQKRVSELSLDTSGEQALSEALQINISELSQRIGDAENSVAALAVRTDTPEKSMDLAEVDYLLRMAGERMALFGDVDSARIALNLADEQLQALNDPLYMAVRRSIGESISALDQVPALDVLLISGEISALQASIPGLPFPGETPVEVIVEDQSDAGLWQKIKNAVKPLVKVRRRVDENAELSIEDKDFLRQGLWLQLESARLSLMRKDAVSWEHSLVRANDSLQKRFDSNSRAVMEASASLEELGLIDLKQDLPDVSSAWRQLKLLREGRPQSVPSEQPAPAEEPVSVNDVEESAEDSAPESGDDGEGSS